MFAKMTAVKR